MGKDSNEIRREIEATRARMGDTVEALSYKADVPARVKDAVNDRVETVKGTIGDVVDSVKHSVTGTTGKVGRSLGGVRDTASDTLSDASGRIGDATGRIGDSLPSAGDVTRAARRGAGIVAENPLGLALGALAVGALVALAVPISDYERRTVGPLRDDLIERAQALSGDAIEHGRAVLADTAQTAMQTAQQSARDHGKQVLDGGLDPQTIASTVVEHGKQVLAETAQAVVHTAQQSAQQHGSAVINEARGREEHQDPNAAHNGSSVEYGALLEGDATV